MYTHTKRMETSKQTEISAPCVFNDRGYKKSEITVSSYFIVCLFDPSYLGIYLAYSNSHEVFANEYTKLLAVSSPQRCE